MSPAATVLAIIPPCFAILVEIFNPVSADLIRASAVRDLERFQLGENQNALIDITTKLTCGAVEVSGLAPTLVATVTSGFGIFYEFPNIWLIVLYILTLLCLALVVLRFLGGQTFYQVEDTRQPRLIFGRTITLPWRGSRAIARLIFFSNGLLITLVLVTYCALERPWTHLIDRFRLMAAHS
jgi:hypothetical protein